MSGRMGRVTPFVVVASVVCCKLASGSGLPTNTLREWNEYETRVEDRWVAAQNRSNAPGSPPNTVAASGTTPRFRATVQRMESPKITGGLIHDWSATAFIPRVTATGAMSLLRDYDRYSELYRPAVISSHFKSRSAVADRFSLQFANTLLHSTVIQADYEARYIRVSDNRWYCTTEATEIREIRFFGSPNQTILPVGQGLGIMWQFLSLLSIAESRNGVLMNLEMIELSRDIPHSFALFLRPLVNHVSRNALLSFLEQTADVLQATSAARRQVGREPTLAERSRE